MSKEGKPIGRFGSRYGTKIRKRVLNVENKYKYQKQICPFCDKKAVSREAAGIYHCSNCNRKFAGGAYEPSTLAKRTLGKVYSKSGAAIQAKVEDIEEVVEEPVSDAEKSAESE